ncbi:Transmembrane protein 130 [Microtus ochrogaster]|uniref:Transmembrane protein 130 n=1 Tax=Microtus ochrogaster TaxID=79684 RepID=A0A8J6KUB8_MICOH|nr:Transmembrane protein 130 [Microtus ochrogaster]
MAKAADVWSDLRLVFWLACLLPFGPARVAAGLYNLSLTTDGPATIGTEVTISASLVIKDNGNLSLPTDAHLYRFHWIHAPLTLTAKTEKNLTSTIHVVGNRPGDFPITVWVTAVDCWMCKPLARSALVLPIKESLVGNLVITQNSSVSWPNSYITKKTLKISFLLHDPSDFFKSASFFYRWDFGDGTLLITDNPVAYYNYSNAGTFTVKVRVVAEWEQTKPDATKGIVQKSGDFSASLRLREALQGIQISAPTLLQTFQKLTMSLKFLGSPPLQVCWGLKPACLPVEDRECHPVLVTGTSLNVTHVFQNPGDYCFIFRAENAISRADQFHRIQVWPSTFQPFVFAFPCATLITVLLVFVMYMTVRSATQQKDIAEVTDFDLSPLSDQSPEVTGLKCCCQLCCGSLFLDSPSEYLEIVRENHGLLPPLYKPMKTYNV